MLVYAIILLSVILLAFIIKTRQLLISLSEYRKVFKSQRDQLVELKTLYETKMQQVIDLTIKNDEILAEQKYYIRKCNLAEQNLKEFKELAFYIPESDVVVDLETNTMIPLE